MATPSLPRISFARLGAVALAASVALGFSPGPASAQTGQSAAQSSAAQPSAERVRSGMYDASDPAGLTRFMENAGYRVDLGMAGGAPQIKGRISRTDYTIQFYECEEGQFCNSVQFAAQAIRPPGLTLEQINAFNVRWRYARLVAADPNIRLLMDLNLDAGITGDNLEDTLDIWRQLLEIFERDILRSG